MDHNAVFTHYLLLLVVYNVDLRLLAINKTVFDQHGLPYPPPLGNSWGDPPTRWTWEKVVEFANIIAEPGKPGFEIHGNYDEEDKVQTQFTVSGKSPITNIFNIAPSSHIPRPRLQCCPPQSRRDTRLLVTAHGRPLRLGLPRLPLSRQQRHPANVGSRQKRQHGFRPSRPISRSFAHRARVRRPHHSSAIVLPELGKGGWNYAWDYVYWVI